ncbi:hypothetical protein [Thiobacter aerophilum]|uniref:Uncharacterized protein n=1 Tax=Thiobacter aerophilum TaxID=3121275 RepID=A0ABV0EGK6_9BURK
MKSSLKRSVVGMALLAAGIAPWAAAGTIAPLPEGVKPRGTTTGVYAHATGVDHLAREMAAQMFATAQAQCPALKHREARLISGSLADAGKWQADAYYTATQSASYTVSTQIAPVSGHDLCDFHEVTLHTVAIASFDGKRTRRISYRPDKASATSLTVPGRRLFTHLNPDKLNGGGMGDFTPTGGREEIAGFPCRVMRASLGPSTQEICVIDSVRVPDYVRQMQLKLSVTLSGRPRGDAQVDVLIPDADIDRGVFALPDGVRVEEKP